MVVAYRIPAAYKVSGLRNSVKDKDMETGILIELGSIEELAKAIIQLLPDEAPRSRLGKRR